MTGTGNSDAEKRRKTGGAAFQQIASIPHNNGSTYRSRITIAQKNRVGGAKTEWQKLGRLRTGRMWRRNGESRRSRSRSPILRFRPNCCRSGPASRLKVPNGPGASAKRENSVRNERIIAQRRLLPKGMARKYIKLAPPRAFTLLFPQAKPACAIWRRLRIIDPIAPKPSTAIAQVSGSGTAPKRSRLKA